MPDYLVDIQDATGHMFGHSRFEAVRTFDNTSTVLRNDGRYECLGSGLALRNGAG